MRSRLRGIAAQFADIPPTLHIVWTAARRWTLAWLLLLAVQGLLPAATVYLTRQLVDGLAVSVGAGVAWETIRPILIPAALMAGVLLLAEALQVASEWVRTAQAELVQDHLSALIHAKAVAVDMAFYESPDYYDQLYRARNELTTRPLTLLENTGSLLQNSITLLAMAAVLIPYGLWLPLVLLVSTLPAFYVVLRFNRRYHRWWERTTADRRWLQYYDTMLTHAAVAPELRLFSLGDHFRTAFQALRRRLRGERLQLLRTQGLAQVAAGIIASLLAGAAVAWMGWRALQGTATLGDLALFYQALTRGQNLLRSLLGNLGQIYNNSLFLGNLFDFLKLQPQIADAPEPVSAPRAVQTGISFRNVTFRYPASERTVLEDFSLDIPAGRIVAIVGANGAGKSTLIKLLCRFYDPTAGRIEIDGTDIRQVKLDELRRMITILFQVPVTYHATAKQNIAMGDLAASPPMGEVAAAAQSAGADEVIARLPRGYDTLLGKWFTSGTELSAGEWQRIALARAFLRRAPIIILDEPTSFMDSWAEAAWFERFRALAEGRTALVITHRFTIAMRADVIHVMHEGKVVESGSHNDLVAQGGLYAQSWTAQMEATPPLPV